MNASSAYLLLWLGVVAGGASTTAGWALRVRSHVECDKSGRYTRCPEITEAFVEAGQPDPHNGVPGVLQMEKMHSPWSRNGGRRPTYDNMVPFTDAAKQNRRNLYALLTSVPLQEGLSEAAQRVCAKLHRTTHPPPSDCIEAPASPPCETIGHQEVQMYLGLLEQSIASAPVSRQAGCGIIHRISVHLYDLELLLGILGISSPGARLPSRSFTETYQQFARNFLQDLHYSLDPERTMTAPPSDGSESGIPTAGSTKTSGTRKQQPGNKQTADPKTAFLTLKSVGTKVSILYNLLFQAWFRRGELFETHASHRRLFPSLSQIILSNSQQRQILLSALCGFVLGSLSKRTRMPKTMWAAPLEFWNTPTRVVGLAKVSCDILRLSMRALDLAETSGINVVNELMDVFSKAAQKQTLHLERNVTAGTNLRRLCFSFSRRIDRLDVSSLLKCRLEDTVLAQQPTLSTFGTEGATQYSARARDAEEATGGTIPESGRGSVVELSSEAQPLRPAVVSASTGGNLGKTPHSDGDTDSLLEANAAAVQGRAVVRLEGEALMRASAYFNWILFQSGGRLLAPTLAEVFSMDLGTWWEHMVEYDMRSISTMKTTATKAAQACKKTARTETSESAERECNKSPEPKYWKKACATKLGAFSCKYSGVLCSSLDTTNVADVMQRAAAADRGAKRPKGKNGRPFVVLTGIPGAIALANKASAYGPAYLRLFQLCSFSTPSNKGLLKGSDEVSAWNSSLAVREVGKKKRRWFEALLPATFRRLRKWIQKRRYTPAMMYFLQENLSAAAKKILLTGVRIVVHPIAFLMINQRSPYESHPTGQRQGKGGYVGAMDEAIAEWSREGLSESLLDKMRSGNELKPADLAGFNIFETPIPHVESFWELTKETLVTHLKEVLFQPQSQAMVRAGCLYPRQRSAVLAAVQDSLMLLRGTPAQNFHIVGAIETPEQASKWKPGFLSRFWSRLKRVAKSLFRVPPWKAQHMVYAGVTIDFSAVTRLMQETVLLFLRFKRVFKNAVAFKEAIYRWLQSVQQRFQNGSRGVQSLPQTTLLPHVHPLYPLLPRPERSREFQESALQLFFFDIWMLIFSISIDNLIDVGRLQKIERQFSSSSWEKSLTDPLAVNSFRMVLFGSDLPLTLYDQLLPQEQKAFLKRTRYGVATAFSQQASLTGKIYLAQNLPSLGSFLRNQGPFLGYMLVIWQRKRKEDRAREILSWAVLALSITAAVLGSIVQTTGIVEQTVTVQNQSSLAAQSTGCPPLGICDTGVIANPIASPPAAAVTAVVKTTLIIGVGTLVGPLIAIWGIATSHIKVLSRLELALRNTCIRLARWFRKKWKGRWFATKQNSFMYQEYGNVKARLDKERQELLEKNAPDLVNQTDEQGFKGKSSGGSVTTDTSPSFTDLGRTILSRRNKSVADDLFSTPSHGKKKSDVYYGVALRANHFGGDTRIIRR